jgi:hypothetical protein
MLGGIWHDINVKMVLVLLTNIKSLEKKQNPKPNINVNWNDKLTQYLACLIV